MVGLGETDEEILQVMRDLRAHQVDMLTIGQYLQPSPHHLSVERYVHPETFAMFEREAEAMGFGMRRSGRGRSSYHADKQAEDARVVAADVVPSRARDLPLYGFGALASSATRSTIDRPAIRPA
jgi:hypothetical protein